MSWFSIDTRVIGAPAECSRPARPLAQAEKWVSERVMKFKKNPPFPRKEEAPKFYTQHTIGSLHDILSAKNDGCSPFRVPAGLDEI